MNISNDTRQHCLQTALRCFLKSSHGICFINCTYRPLKPSAGGTEVILKMLILFMIFSGAIIGNGVMLITIAKTKRLHTTTNYFLVNLSIGDLLVSIFNIWPFGIHHLQLIQSSPWMMSTFGCKISRFMRVIATTGSSMTLTLIAYDRFIGIMFALKSRIIPRRASLYMAIIWLVSAVVATPIFIFTSSENRYWTNHVEKWCDYSFSNENNRKGIQILFLTMTIMFYFCPAIVMTATYICIICKLWLNRLMPGDGLGNNSSQESTLRIKRRKKVTTMLILILIIFYVCWTPVQIINLIEVFGSKVKFSMRHHTMEFITNALAFLNALLYPFLYAGYNKKFKEAFHETFSCRLIKVRKERHLVVTSRYNSEQQRTTGTETSAIPLTKTMSS